MYTGYSSGEFIDTSLISIPVDNMGVNRGYGAFDFFGVVNGKPFYLERHLDRFMNTIGLLRLKIPNTRSEIKELIEEVLLKNEPPVLFMKLFALPLYPDAARNLESGLYIIPVTMDPYDENLYKNGGTLITKEYTRFLPEAKSTNYLPLIFWSSEISKNNAVDVLYCSNGTIQETSRGNIFIVKGSSVYTPGSGVLKGITRSVVMDILKSWDITFLEQTISMEELYQADEVFLTSTTKKVLPIVSIDEKKIGTGKVGEFSKNLIGEFEALQNGYGAK